MRDASMRRQEIRTANSQVGALSVSFLSKKLLWSVLALAFLVAAVAGSLTLANRRATMNNQKSHDTSTLNVQSESGTAAGVESLQQAESAGESTNDPEGAGTATSDVQNISTHSTVTNGKADVSVTVNGEEVPVNNPGVTHEVVGDASNQSHVNVVIGGTNQTSSHSSNSSSHSVNGGSFTHTHSSSFFITSP